MTNLEAKHKMMCERAIGKTLKVRLDKRTRIQGTIIECTPSFPKRVGQRVYQAFQCKVECGVAKVVHTVNVLELPQ